MLTPASNVIYNISLKQYILSYLGIKYCNLCNKIITKNIYISFNRWVYCNNCFKYNKNYIQKFIKN